MKIKTAADYKQIKSSVVTIGTFDGVHIGHQQIIHRLVDTALKNNLQALVLTFFPHPRMVIQNDANIKLINTINKFLLGNIKINFTFLNVVNKDNMIKRLKKRKSLNRYDKFNNIFYKNVQNGFLKLLRKNKKKYLMVNSNLDIEKNKSFIINKIDQLI